MARRFTLQIIMDLATKIGANPSKLAGTRTNISFLGKGPSKNPLFQNRLAGLENATEANLGKPETLFGAIEDAVGWAKDGKLNSIQTEILGHNLSGINKILNPPVLPSASVTPIRSGIGGLRKSPQRVQEIMDDMAMIEDPASVGLKRFPKESHKFFGRPLKDKDFSEIDRMIMEGKIPDARGRTWNLKVPETGAGDLAAATARRTAQTGMSRAIARQILLQDTRIKLPPEVIQNLRLSKDLGKRTAGHLEGTPAADPLQIMEKYYGRSMTNFDDWMNNILSRRVAGANAQELADLALKEIELIPQFAEGGLAEILQAPRSGYKRGRVVSPGGYQGEEEKSEFSIWKPSTWSLGGPESETNPTLFGTQNSLLNKADIGLLKHAIGIYEASGELNQEQQLDYELKLKQLEALIAGAQNKAKGGLAEILEL